MSNPLWTHGLQNARLSYPSLSSGVCSNSCPLSQWCHPTICPLLLPSPPAFSLFTASESFPMSQFFALSGQEYQNFSFSICPSNEYSGLISFRIDWFDLLAIQGALKYLLQHHNSKASTLQHSAFFMVQLSHPYVTARKTIALTRQTFVNKVISLLFNTMSRFAIAFLPRSKHLLISCRQSQTTVILKLKKI